jgi:hypothetical protein
VHTLHIYAAAPAAAAAATVAAAAQTKRLMKPGSVYQKSLEDDSFSQPQSVSRERSVVVFV